VAYRVLAACASAVREHRCWLSVRLIAVGVLPKRCVACRSRHRVKVSAHRRSELSERMMLLFFIISTISAVYNASSPAMDEKKMAHH